MTTSNLTRLLALFLTLGAPTLALAEGIVIAPASAHKEADALLNVIKANDAVEVSALLAAGADPNQKNRFGNSALTLAIGTGSLEIVTALVDAGADLKATGKKDHPLHDAASADQVDIVKLLLARGADVDARDAAGRTPLRAVSPFANRVEVIKVLLEAGADPSAQDGDQEETALHHAVWHLNYDLAELLIAHGADPAIADRDGMTPLQMAMDKNSAEMLEILAKTEAP